MATQVQVQPDMLQWAFLRSGKDIEGVAKKFPYTEWLEGKKQPTIKQLENFAKAMHVPFSYLFLPEPPVEELPIRDFRTVGSENIGQPSPDLLDTIYDCQERQSWYQGFARIHKHGATEFIGKATLKTDPNLAAKEIRQTLGFDIKSQQKCKGHEEAFRLLVQHAENIGILVMVSGTVRNDTHRNLKVKEFRGFALADEIAPLIFINGKDSDSAKIFTFAHELAHLWLGVSGLSDTTAQPLANKAAGEEVWCNKVAAEMLVPMDALLESLNRNSSDASAEAKRLADYFKVSKSVMLRRLLDSGWLSQDEFGELWRMEMGRIRRAMEKKKESTSGGGDFYKSAKLRFSTRFTQALIESTLEGQTLYRDAFRLLGISKASTLKELGKQVGVGT